MLEKIFHLLSGYAEFEIHGDHARFFNICAKRGIEFWGFEKENDTAVARVKAREYRKLLAVCRRCRVRTRVRKKRGLAFVTRRFFLRRGLVAGAVFATGIYVFLSSFVWGISVTGTQTLTDKQVLAAAESFGVYEGAKKQDLEQKRAAYGIQTALTKVSWASVNDDGCFIEIAIKERVEKPEITDDSLLSNIVASQAGKVVEIQAEHGRPEIIVGDAVEEGQLLISGLYEEIVDPYGIQPEKPLQTQGAARGSVTAETYREFTVQASRTETTVEKTGERKINRALAAFGIRIPMGFNTVPEGKWRSYERELPLMLLGKEMPVSVKTTVYEFTAEKSRVLTDEELKDAALRKLREAQKAVIAQGGKVIGEELQFLLTENGCILNAKCHCVEEIGEVRPILLGEEKSDKMLKG